MTEEFRKRIIEDIQKTGFPVELKAATHLRRHGWSVEQNTTYLDLELRKSREIDVIARKSFGYAQDSTNRQFAINLSIEVKKSEKGPWVFFMTPAEDLGEPYRGPAFGQITHSYNFSSRYLSAKQFMENFPRNEGGEAATSYYEAFKSPDEPSKIYEAMLSAVKAAFHQRRIESFEDLMTPEEIEEEYEREFDPNEPQVLEVFMPIVILEGMLCKAWVNNKEEIEIEDAKYVPVSISHHNEPYHKSPNYYPEVLTIDYLDEFRQKLDMWGKSVINEWKK